MSRFIQEKPKMATPKKPQATLPKPGKYTAKDLQKAKPIYTQGGKQ